MKVDHEILLLKYVDSVTLYPGCADFLSLDQQPSRSHADEASANWRHSFGKLKC